MDTNGNLLDSKVVQKGKATLVFHRQLFPSNWTILPHEASPKFQGHVCHSSVCHIRSLAYGNEAELNS